MRSLSPNISVICGRSWPLAGSICVVALAILAGLGYMGNVWYHDFGLSEPLIESCFDGDTAKAESLLRKGADVNYVDDEGVTPLYAAVANNHLETARLLLKRGAVIRDVSFAPGLWKHAAQDGVAMERLLHRHP